MNLSKSYDFFQPEKYEDRIHIIGCGSIGSTVAENIARGGVTKFALWDFDVVEARNIANQLFRQKDVGTPKVKALLDILTEINPDIPTQTALHEKGWRGEPLSGFVFLCVDNIELRRKIVEENFSNPYIKAMFDFRTGLEEAQHFAADWSDYKMRKDFLASMQFSHEEAKAETPMSACNVTLSVCPTVRIVSALGVANFMNFWREKPIKKMMIVDAFNGFLEAF